MRPTQPSLCLTTRQELLGSPGGESPVHEDLFGRQELLEDVWALLRHERWVTLCGPAGIGKSRLARELWRRATVSRAEGEQVFFCELVDVGSVASLADATARALGLELPDSDPASLGGALNRLGPSLVVLDGLDVGVVPPESWLAAKEVRFLVTARRRLGLRREVAVEVGPLETPTDGGRDPLASAAARLFAARVGSESPVLERPDLVAELVRALDGNPLAIELVARIVGMRPALAVDAAQLDKLLERGRVPDDDPVSSALLFSWPLLEDEARTELALLSIFPASFTAEAAAAVLDRPELRGLERSFVHVFMDPRGGEERLRLHDAVRAFAAQRLHPAERARAVIAHARHYGALGARVVSRLERRHEPSAVLSERLEAPNLEAALVRAAEVAPAAAASAGLALESDLTTRGRYDEALALAERCLEAAIASGDPRLLARATAMRGEVRRRRWLQGALDDHAAAVRVGVSDPVLCARLHRRLGAVQRDLGQLHQASITLCRARTLLDGVEAPRELAMVELALANLHRRRDEHELGLIHAEAALTTARGAGDRLLEGRAALILGLLHDDGGSLELALRLVEDAIEILRAHGDRWMEEMALNAAGLLHAELGHPVEARGCFEEALSICEDAGFRAGLSCITGNLGWLEFAEGRPDRAALRLRHSVAQAVAVGYRFAEALYGASLGAVEASRDRLDEAVAAMAAAVAVAEEVGCPGLLATVTVLRGVLDVALSRQARAAGDLDGAAGHLERAEQRLAAGRAQRRPDGDLRSAVRTLTQALGGAASGGSPAETLQLLPCERVAVFGGRRVSLTKHPSLWRMLVCLSRAIHPVTVEGLFAAGWPGERIVRHAARNRVHVGLSSLRRLGLASLLCCSDEGYLLAPHVLVCVRGPEAA